MADEEPETDNRVKYTVYSSNIKDDDGEKKCHGEPVELGPKLARHYNNLGYLRPFIPDADDEDEVVQHAKPANPTQKRAIEESTPTPRSNRTTAAKL